MISASVIFSADDPAFNGHFPGNPILPAFMHVQAALDVLSSRDGGRANLARIEGARFSRPIRPGDPVGIQIAPLATRGFLVTLSVGSEQCSRFDLYTQDSVSPGR